MTVSEQQFNQCATFNKDISITDNSLVLEYMPIEIIKEDTLIE